MFVEYILLLLLLLLLLLHHPNTRPKLTLSIMEKAMSTNNRKIREARIISKNKPDLNDRDEQTAIRQYLI